MTLKIETMTAFISVDDEGEGLAAFQGQNGMWMPLIAADPARTEQLRSIAQVIADRSGKEIKEVHFSVRTDVDTIVPGGNGGSSDVG